MQLDDFKIGPFKFRDPFGQTFSAEQRESGQVCDITILHPALADIPEFRQAFREDAEAAARLSSPNLVRVVGSGAAPGGDFLVCESGGLTSFMDLLADHRFFSIPATVSFIQTLASTTRSVHIEGLVHGALSPHFIMTDSQFSRVRISRCGFERSLRLLIERNEASLSGATPYFSPEIMTPRVGLSRQSDIFSIGVLFYQLLVGRLPWPENPEKDGYDPYSRLGVVPPSLQRIEIPDTIDEVILRALEPEIKDRWANLSSFIKALSEVQAGLMASFTPTSALILQPDLDNGQTVPPEPPLADSEKTPASVNGWPGPDYLHTQPVAFAPDTPMIEPPFVEPEPAVGPGEARAEQRDVPEQFAGGPRPTESAAGALHREPERTLETAVNGYQDRPELPEVSAHAGVAPPAVQDMTLPLNSEPVAGRDHDDSQRPGQAGDIEAQQKEEPDDAASNDSPERKLSPAITRDEDDADLGDFPDQEEPTPLFWNAGQPPQSEPALVGREEETPQDEPQPDRGQPVPVAAGEEDDPVLAGTADLDGNYKQRLLDHEKDFFVDLTGDPETQIAAAGAPDANGEETLGEISGEGLPSAGPGHEVPDVQPLRERHIISPEPRVLAPARAAGVPESSAPRAFAELQASEFDDSLSLRRRSVSSGTTKPAAAARPPQENGVAKTETRPTCPISKAKPQPTTSAQAPTAADAEVHSGTQTADFEPTEALRRQPLIPAVSPILSWLRTTLLVVAPLTLIYLLVSFVFNVDFDFRNSLFWQRFSGSTSGVEAGRSSEDLSNPVVAPRRKVTRTTETLAGSAPAPRNVRRPNGPRREAGSNLLASRTPVLPAPDNTRSRPAAARNVQAERPTELTLALLVEAGNVPQVADVFLDGRRVGSTSTLGRFDIKNLIPEHSYLIKVQKAGFKMWAREVRFQKRGTQQLFVRLAALHNLSSSARPGRG